MNKLPAKTRTILEIVVAYIAVLSIVITAPFFRSFASNIPTEMLIKYCLYLLMVGAVVLICKIGHDPLGSTLGLQKTNLGNQVALAVPVFILSASLTIVIPLLWGVNPEFLLSKKVTDPTIIVLTIIHQMVFVGLVEELVFRGYLLEKLKVATHSGIWAVVISSLLFGFMHFPVGQDFLQLFVTAFIGMIFGFSRLWLKNCSTLSVGIAHGLHNTFILILSSILL